MTSEQARRSETIAVVLASCVLVASLAIAVQLLLRDEPVEAVAAVPSTGAAEPAAASGALMIARRSGEVLVGVSARPGAPVELHVFAEEEAPLAQGTVQASVNGEPMRLLAPAGCGEACYRLEAVPFTGTPLRVAVEIARSDLPLEAVRFQLPARMPPSGAELLAKAKRTMLALRSVRIEETLTAGAATLRSSWQIKAPNRLSVDASDGGRSVLIGKVRWDLIDGSWRKSTWDGSRQPWYPWTDAVNARVLGKAIIDGRPVRKLATFVTEPELWWFVLFVDEDGRVLREEMLAPSHFMVDRFSGFDEPVTIEPPA